MWNISVSNKYKKLNLNVLIFYYSHLCNQLPLFYYTLPITKRISNKIKKTNSRLPIELVSKKKLTHIFKVFLSVSFTNQGSRIIIHPSQKYYYVSHGSGGSSPYSVSLLYNIFSKFVLLIFNIYYFKLKFLSFGSNSTKSDILATSWSYLSPYKNPLRYSPQSIFFAPNKMNDKYPFIFPFWKLNGYNISILYDVTYHLKTLYYLHRFNFFSIGFIPANLPKYKLSLAIPVLNDSWVTQLFLVRLTASASIKQKSLYYSKLKKSWSVL
jgi:hypothetical protein